MSCGKRALPGDMMACLTPFKEEIAFLPLLLTARFVSKSIQFPQIQSRAGNGTADTLLSYLPSNYYFTLNSIERATVAFGWKIGVLAYLFYGTEQIIPRQAQNHPFFGNGVVWLSRGVMVRKSYGAVIKLLVKPAKSEQPAQITKESSQKTAEDFVRNCPTFAFDGVISTLGLKDSKSLAVNSWQFTYEFDCRHAGYGDRAGQALAQVITHHHAVITVEEGTVTEAILDSRWSETTQEEIAGN